MCVYDSLPWDIIKDEALSNGLEPYLVGAIIWQESRGNTWAIRFEPRWNYETHSLDAARIQGTTQETQIQLQKFSYGLMQIMGTVAYELGYRDSLMKLCAYPRVGVKWGCIKLASLKRKYSATADLISAYNGGSVIKDINGKRLNDQSYVEPVIRYYQEIVKLKGE